VVGLEPEDGSGNISYEAENHERMTQIRAEKVQRIAQDIPPLEVDHEDGAELLVLGWGSTYGAITAGVRRVRAAGKPVAAAHLYHLNPFPRNLGEVLSAYPRVLIPEMNTGQLAMLVRARFLVDAESYGKVRGQPITADEVEREILARV
jgi:2-oxoglutarate/2-oxoacid ferredoxin oxidoreductase subunit alpha